MKKLFLPLLVVIALGACNNQVEPVSGTMVFGKVKPIYQQYLAFTFGEFLDSVKIEDTGEFQLTIPASTSGFGILMYNNALVEVYLEPDKSLEISINSNNFPNSIEFGGDLGPINHYSQLSRKLDQQSEKSSQDLFSMETEAFLNFSDSIRAKKEMLLEEYVVKYPELDSVFAKNKKTNILYTWASQQLLYPGYYALIKNQLPPLPYNYHQLYLDKLELSKPELLSSEMYKTFLENYLDYKEAVYLDNHPEVQKLWFPGSVSRFRVIHEEFSDSDIKDYLLFTSMGDHLDNFGTEHVESFITNFRVACTNKEYQSDIEEKFKLHETLARGEQAPELEFFDREGNKVKLSELSGQLLYINFWASWSEWSIQEFPYWEKLRKDFDGYEVQFLSVSMDFSTDKNKWEYILDKQKLEGLHLIQDPGSSAFHEVYFINDLPRYLLIDKDGKMISAHAPRPSENMDSVLKALLDQEN